MQSISSKIKFYFCLTLAFILFFSLFTSSAAQAAKLYFTPQSETIGLTNDFLVNINLEAINSINAVSAAISISDEAEPVDIISGNSIINFWVEKPGFDPKTRLLTFSGIIPGGFTGQKAWLMMIKFRPQKAGQLKLTFLPDQTQVLLNSPDGAKDKLEITNLSLPVIKELANATVADLNDTVAPENFTPQIASDPNLGHGQKFLVFATQDKGLGIDHYEVQEKIFSRIFNLTLWQTSWIKAESPYLLADQNLTSRIFIKAVDRAGNETLSELSPTKLLAWYQDDWVWVIILIMMAVLAKYLLAKRQGHKN